MSTAFLPSDTPTSDFALIAPRITDQEYYPEHRDGVLYIRTNDTGRNFRLVTTSVGSPGRADWQELLPLNPDAPLEDFDLFQTFLVTSHRELGLPVMDVFPLTGSSNLGTPARIAFSRADLLGGSTRQPRVRCDRLPLQLPVPRLAPHRSTSTT